MLFVVVAALVLLSVYVWRSMPTAAENQELAARMARWVIFTVVLSIIPLIIDYLAAAAHAHGNLPGPSEVYSKGELCLTTTALAGVAAGEILGLSERAKTPKIILGGLCVIFSVCSIAIYGMIKSNSDPLALPTFAQASVWLFGGALLISTSTIAVAELQK